MFATSARFRFGDGCFLFPARFRGFDAVRAMRYSNAANAYGGHGPLTMAVTPDEAAEVCAAWR